MRLLFNRATSGEPTARHSGRPGKPHPVRPFAIALGARRLRASPLCAAPRSSSMRPAASMGGRSAWPVLAAASSPA